MTQPESIVTLADWLNTPAGRYVRAWEQQKLVPIVSDVFGFHAVQIGLPSLCALEGSRILHRSLMAQREDLIELQHSTGQTAPCWNSLTLSQYDDLPIASQTVDLVVLPHTLEFAADPHSVLREVERILIPEGMVVITGFNPYSLFALRRGFLPNSDQLIGLKRLKDWFKLLGFEASRGHFGCYAWPSKRGHSMHAGNRWDKAGDRWWPVCGATYCVAAIKRVRGMRLIGPSWKTRKEKARAAAWATRDINLTQEHD